MIKHTHATYLSSLRLRHNYLKLGATIGTSSMRVGHILRAFRTLINEAAVRERRAASVDLLDHP